jgi:hypothetical protein
MNGINEYDADILERRVHFAILFALASEFPFTLAYFDRAGTMPQCLNGGTLKNGFQHDSNTEHTHMHKYFDE